MASISRDASGKVRVMFTGADKKRRTVYVGKVNKKLAETIKMRVETLVAAIATRTPLDNETAAWVVGIGDDLAGKLAAVGLIAERPRAITMAGLLKMYLDEKEVENKGGTRTNHRTISNDLNGFFGEGSDPRAITPERVRQFLDHRRDRELAAGTVSRRIRRVRSIFAHAVKRGGSPPTRSPRSGPCRCCRRSGGRSSPRPAPRSCWPSPRPSGGRSSRWPGSRGCGAPAKC